MSEKELYQIAMWYESKSFPIEWNKLPDELIDSISSDYIEDRLSYSKDNGIGVKSVLYFRKVKKFRKDIENKYETENLIFGT